MRNATIASYNSGKFKMLATSAQLARDHDTSRFLGNVGLIILLTAQSSMVVAEKESKNVPHVVLL